MTEEKKKTGYRPDDYLYCSARIRSLETKLADASVLERMSEAENAAAAVSMLAEKGIISDKEDFNTSLDRFLHDSFSLMMEISPGQDIVTLASLPYDCHNIKTAVKCSIMDRDPDGMLYDFGSVSPKTVTEAAAERKFDLLPTHMAEAAEKAFDVYAASKDPQLIDALIDSACFEDMLEAARQTGDPFFADWVRVKADLTNILITVRIIRMGGEYDSSYLERMLVPCGTLEKSLFTDALYDGEIALWAKISNTAYFPVCKVLENDPGFTLSTIERECENYSMSVIKNNDRYTISGAVVVFGYLTACEYMAKNARIIIASKTAGKDVGVIKERMRKSYV